jgi:hypothetical protein
MLAIEIPPNANCEAVDLRVFNDLEPPRRVTHVRIESPAAGRKPAWYQVTGWTLDGRPCDALARRVDDSGEGVAILVSGGDAGLRLQPEDSRPSWGLNDRRQHGLPFLLVADPADLRFDPLQPPLPS